MIVSETRTVNIYWLAIAVSEKRPVGTILIGAEKYSRSVEVFSQKILNKKRPSISLLKKVADRLKYVLIWRDPGPSSHLKVTKPTRNSDHGYILVY
jgi:hypothetical protein